MMRPMLRFCLLLVLLGPVLPCRGQQPRGYTIPLVDLAAETHRQVVVDREPGQYLGHPTTVLLDDGATMLAVYPRGHGRGAIVLKRSPDGGRTWSERLPVPANWATSQEVPTLYRMTGPDGRERLVLFSGLYPIRRAISEDDGVTWSPLEPIGDFGGIVAMADVARRTDGAYLAFFHDDGRFLHGEGTAGPFYVYQTRSSDGGLTWSAPEVVVTHPEAHLCEPGLVRSPDGRQWALLLRENSRQFNSFVTFSNDEGTTWSPPVELPGALTGDRHQAVYAPDGRLFISFRDRTHASPTWGDWVGWVGTYEDLVEGGEGQYRVRLMDNLYRADTAYPALERLPDGTIVATTYGHWDAGAEPYIVSVRFTLDELDARAAQIAAAPPRPTLVDVVKIWDAAPHHAFTDLIRFKGTWFSTFREGERHVHGEDGTIRVLGSEDGTRWESAAVVAEAGVDLRDPKLSVTPDGRLMLVAGGSIYEDEALVTRRPRVAFSHDGRTWSPLYPVLAEGDWLWRVTWHEGRAYGVSYTTGAEATGGEPGALTLYRSDDGLAYEPVTTLSVPGRPNETTLRFLADGTMQALVRREGQTQNAWIGTSPPPYTAWTWHETDQRVGGPNFIVLPDGTQWAAGRSYGAETKTVLARMDAQRYEPVLTLPSGGDTGYPGLAWHDGLLWISYYASHEGRAAIYLARVRLP